MREVGIRKTRVDRESRISVEGRRCDLPMEMKDSKTSGGGNPTRQVQSGIFVPRTSKEQLFTVFYEVMRHGRRLIRAVGQPKSKVDWASRRGDGSETRRDNSSPGERPRKPLALASPEHQSEQLTVTGSLACRQSRWMRGTTRGGSTRSPDFHSEGPTTAGPVDRIVRHSGESVVEE